MPLAKSHANNHAAHPPPSALRATEGTSAASWKVEKHAAGAVLYQPADEVRHLYLIKHGRVRLQRLSGSGIPALVALLGPGEVFGDPLDGSAAGELATAGSDLETWSLPSADLRTFCARHPDAAADLVAGMNARMRNLRRRVVGFTAREVPARLTDALLSLGERHGDPCTHGGEIDLRNITQQDLADMVGASRSFVSTLINEMKRDGALGSVGRVLCLRDLKALRKAAQVEA